MIAPKETDPKNTAETLQRIVREVLNENDMADLAVLPASSISYSAGDTIGSLMTALDGALAMSDEQGQSEVAVASKEGGSAVPSREQGKQWRAQLMARYCRAAIANGYLSRTHPGRGCDPPGEHAENPRKRPVTQCRRVHALGTPPGYE